MQTISKSKLKANMLEIFRQIEVSGEELIVTHHDKPVLRITPIKAHNQVGVVFAGLQGKVEYGEDPDTPTIDEWSQL